MLTLLYKETRLTLAHCSAMLNMWPGPLCPREQPELQSLYLHSRQSDEKRFWRIKEAIGSYQLSLKECSLILPHDTSDSIWNLIIWSSLSTRENRKCYFIWDIFPTKECKFYSHRGKKEWILMKNGILVPTAIIILIFTVEEMNTQKVTHLFYVRARIWIPFFLIQIQQWFHYTTAFISWNMKWLTFHNDSFSLRTDAASQL